MHPGQRTDFILFRRRSCDRIEQTRQILLNIHVPRCSHTFGSSQKIIVNFYR